MIILLRTLTVCMPIKESLPENKQFILENNKETLAQVFTDVRYTKKDSEAMSENLWKIMKKQGF